MKEENKWLIINDNMSDKELAEMYAAMENLAEEASFVPKKTDVKDDKPMAS